MKKNKPYHVVFAKKRTWKQFREELDTYDRWWGIPTTDNINDIDDIHRHMKMLPMFPVRSSKIMTNIEEVQDVVKISTVDEYGYARIDKLSIYRYKRGRQTVYLLSSFSNPSKMLSFYFVGRNHDFSSEQEIWEEDDDNWYRKYTKDLKREMKSYRMKRNREKRKEMEKHGK